MFACADPKSYSLITLEITPVNAFPVLVYNQLQFVESIKVIFLQSVSFTSAMFFWQLNTAKLWFQTKGSVCTLQSHTVSTVSKQCSASEIYLSIYIHICLTYFLYSKSHFFYILLIHICLPPPFIIQQWKRKQPATIQQTWVINTPPGISQWYLVILH